MGGRLTRLVKNFNLENRAHREIGRAKPLVAPGYPSKTNTVEQTPEKNESIHKKDDPLLSLLKSVYVESKDPQVRGDGINIGFDQSTDTRTLQVTKQPQAMEEQERRLLKFSLPGDPYGILNITDVPKGKLSIVEALTALNSHKQSPKTWSPEKIAQEYSLDLKDAKALLDFFVPFDVKIIPPKTGDPKQIKAT